VLYVRETFQGWGHNGRWWHETGRDDRALLNWDLFYKGEVDAGMCDLIAPAPLPSASPQISANAEYLGGGRLVVTRWIPSIHMQKWASRMKLGVKRVWVEQVQDITGEGIHAEGCPKEYHPAQYSGMTHAAYGWFEHVWDGAYRDRYPWSSNPWVWCCEFSLLHYGVGA